MDIEKTGKDILDAAFAIHSKFGNGLLEKACRIVLATERRRLGHTVEEENVCGFEFNGVAYENMFRVDLLVDETIVVEVKSVNRMDPVFAKQCLTCLKLLGKPLGFVLNFGMPSLKEGIVRLANNLQNQTSRTSRTSREEKQGENP
ncbi:MAG: GxxExxY protein [Kiritimatiellae bacterium]|nr:GxxExxY protein [Kiritimatiellia bacterium]